MLFNLTRVCSKPAALALAILLLTEGTAFAQSVSLTASRQTTLLPDGNTVPMWGWTCGTPGGGVTCTALTGPAGVPAAQIGGATWQPPLITVPTGSGLTITLTNSLPTPTSLVIVGQSGLNNPGGLGNPVKVNSPAHPPQTVATWPINAAATFTPPTQGQRAQSLVPEAAVGGSQTYIWSSLKPGTYLIESGTNLSIQGPMGLYGVLVVTQAPGASAGVAYPGINYGADVVALLSEIDPVQNTAADTAVVTPGFNAYTKWNPTCGKAGTCYPPAVDYTPLYFLINGKSFDKTAPNVLAVGSAAAVSSNVLVRFVNAGLHMHVPSVVRAQVNVGNAAQPANGIALIAEDANIAPDIQVALGAGTTPKPKIQSEVMLAAGKVYDVLFNPPAAAGVFTPATFPMFDRALDVSSGGGRRDAGMQAVIQVNGGAVTPARAAAVNDYYVVPLGATTFSNNVLSNDIGIYSAALGAAPAHGTVTLNPNGSFTYKPNGPAIVNDTFTYFGNGTTATSTTPLVATVTLAVVTQGAPPTALAQTFSGNMAAFLKVARPGALAGATDPGGYALTAAPAGSGLTAGTPFTVTGTGGSATVTLNADGSILATAAAPGTYSFNYVAVNSQNTASTPNTVTLTFPAGSGLQVTVQDAKTAAKLTDYRWIIEQDLTFKVDPSLTNTGQGAVPSLATNFHTSHMPTVAAGCTGPISCEAGQTVYNPSTGGHDVVPPQPAIDPSQVALDASQTYYVSVLPGDAANPFNTGNIVPGHTMGGAPIPAACKPAAGATSCTGAFSPVTVKMEPSPLPTAQLTVFVFEDDNETNGEVDSDNEEGGTCNTEPCPGGSEPGLGGFEIELMDDAGSTGDPTGQMTYDMFNMPLTNALNGLIDPRTGLNACPISNAANTPTAPVGVIITCPDLESDGKTESPLRGHAVIKNLMPGRFGVVARPGAERLARGEEWVQTNTLDGTRFLDAFVRAGEPAYFQEYGPPGLHVFMGFMNPAITNGVRDRICNGTQNPFGGGPAAGPPPACNNTISGQITNLHITRPPNENLYDSAMPGLGGAPQGDPKNRALFSSTQCYVTLGILDSPNIQFTKCDADGNFKFTGVPDGEYSVTVFDQWLHQLMFEKEVQVANGQNLNIGTYPVFDWFTNIMTKVCIDRNGNGICDPGEDGVNQIPVRIRFRDGSFANTLTTDGTGSAVFDETFALFNWYVTEADTTRYKSTGVHVVYDAGGPLDTTGPYQALLNSKESFPVPANLRVPGAVYCDTASCTGLSITNPGASPGGATARIDPPNTRAEAFQGFAGQTQVIEWAKTPYAVGENGGLTGHVVYSSTRPFDDPRELFQNLWEPLVPGVKINLYQEGTAPDGSQSLTLIDTTTTSSWDAWAHGTNPATGQPNMNCPGQDPSDPFLSYTLGTANQYKCYDGMHNWNQILPAPYDGMWKFPSVTATATGAGTNCAKGAAATATTPAVPGCVPNPVDGTPMLLPGKYVVEEVTPPNYEVVREEDKNILIGDAFIAPLTQQFGTAANIFIIPDQASINAYNAAYNPNLPPGPTNVANPTTDMGRTFNFGGFGPGGLIVMPAPCVGNLRVVPDYMSIFPQSGEVAPFAGALRHLCDRKELTLEDQMQAQADFFIWTKTPAASKFTGFVLDDFSSEFDPTSPDFGEKFAVPNLPVAIRDFNGVEVSRGYSDQWGIFNGMVYSTWQVNPPNPTGYSPGMMITCMNDPGPIPGPNGTLMRDPYFNPLYSDFCYENPFMPGRTDYLDTPVVPVAAFASGYNPPDCAYPDATPAISRVDGNGRFGPYIDLGSANPPTLTITALGDQIVPNNGYSGPAASTAPFNQKTVTRHYGFGTQCTSVGGACTAVSSVTIGDTALAITSWSDTQIVATVPPTARTGELLITVGNGKTSIDTVTVTVENSTVAWYRGPTYVNGENSSNNALQTALNNAHPGDLIIVNGMVSPTSSAPPGTTCTVPNASCTATLGTYPELLIMWKPVRLQGVGAASVLIDANSHPAGKLDAWRAQMFGLFGEDLNGELIPGAISMVDPLPAEFYVGFTFGGTPEGAGQPPSFQPGLEPALMSAEEGAGITIVGKNLGAPGVTGTICSMPVTGGTAYNFSCYPSRIDGFGFTNSAAGGGIFAHGWAHRLEISNNRVFGNGGTIAGGIHAGVVEADPPYPWNANIYLHNNAVTENASFGDEFNTDTPAAGGGIALLSGSDNYRIQRNFVCGNLSNGDGGGINHFGLSKNGNISHNTVIFNQSFNQTITTAGGGIAVQGSPPGGNCEGPPFDPGCPQGLTEGTGNVTIDSNLIMGNLAEGGSGGGVRLQDVNGVDVSANPTNPLLWYRVTLTNNVIANNIAAWAGGGISMFDAALTSIVNNTIISNDSTATAGVLFDTVGAVSGNVPNTTPITTSTFQPAGIEAEPHGALLQRAFGPVCSATVPPPCVPAVLAENTKFSNADIDNNIVWQNRSFYMSVGNLDIKGVQNSVQLNPALSVGAGYACASGANYWDIGVLGDTSQTPGSGPAHFRLHPTYSLLDDPNDYPSAHNISGNPQVVRQYCNGSRTTPGIPDLDPFYPLFTLTPAATVDEGNNWVNLRFGPLSTVDSSVTGTPGTVQNPLGDYSITAASAARDQIPLGTEGFTEAPHTDFFGNPRPDPANPNAVDIGAVELQGLTQGTVTFSAGAFGSVLAGTTTQLAIVATVGLTAPVTFNSSNITGSATFTIVTDGCAGTTVAPGGACTVTVQYAPRATATNNGVLHFADNAMGSPQAVPLTGAGVLGTASPSANAAAFGTVQAGAPAVSQTVTVTNSGTGALTFGNAPASGVSGTNFTKGADGCSGTSVQPGGTCTIAVILTPTAPYAATGSISRTGWLTIRNNGTTGNVTVNLTATVVQAVVAISAPVGNLTAGGTTTKNATITVTNSGAWPLTLTAAPTIVKTAGPAAGTFSPPTGTCTASPSPVLVAGGSCTIQVQYNPGGNTYPSTAHVGLVDSGAAATTQVGANFNAN